VSLVALFGWGAATARGVPQIFVEWGLPGTPQQPNDYEVDYSDSNFPDIELKTGDTTWNVWSRDSVTGAVSDIGDITAFGEADYGLILADLDGDPGARDVLSIVLTPAGAHDSGIAAYYLPIPSRITGDLVGELTLSDAGSIDGAYCELTVGGDVSGTWYSPGPTYVIIEGNVTSTADLTFGYLPESSLEVYGNVAGPIEVTEGMEAAYADDAWIWIGGDLSANLTVGKLTEIGSGEADIYVGGDCSAAITVNYQTPGELPANARITVDGQDRSGQRGCGWRHQGSPRRRRGHRRDREHGLDGFHRDRD